MLTGALLALAVAVQLACAAALLRMPRAYDRLHFASLANLCGVVLVAGALVPQVGTSGLPKLTVTFLLTVAMNALATHVVALAVRRSRRDAP